MRSSQSPVAPIVLDDDLLIEGENADSRSDQFAFGLTAWELLAGDYAGGPLVLSIPFLSDVKREIPVEVAYIVKRTLEREKEKRYPSMDDVANAFRDALPSIRAHTYDMSSTADSALARLTGAGSNDAKIVVDK